MSIEEQRRRMGRGRGPSGAPGGALRTQGMGASAAQASPQRRVLGDIASTALMAGFLWWRLGPMVAVAVLVGIFVHEYGHVLAMNRLGCGPARMRIVPFVGGSATPARPPATEFKGVLIALAGPVFGLLAAVPFVIAAAVTRHPLWVMGALSIAAINLVNLAPAPPLDGSKALGPALARIHPQLERWALIAVGGVAVLWALDTRNWIFGLFVAMGAYAAYKRPSLRPWALKLTRSEFRLSVAMYLGALALCLFAGWASLAAVGVQASPTALLSVVGIR